MRENLRGQPLAVLGIVIACWVGVRTITWQPPEAKLDLLLGEEIARDIAQPATAPEPAMPRSAGFTPISYAAPYGIHATYPPPAPWGVWPAYAAAPFPRHALAMPPRYAPAAASGRMAPAYPAEVMAGAAAFPSALVDNGYRLPGEDLPPLHLGQSTAAAPAPVPLSPGLAEGKVDRWSADAWMLTRKEGRAAFSGGQPIYGGSQAGAVLRYRLAPNSAHRPLAYLRTSQALGQVPESELALGLGARAVASVPVMFAVEGRAFRSGRKTRFRPAALAYTELPPFPLPAGFRGEAYLQGGYVGGDFKTGFADGQLRVDRRFLSFAGHEIRLGGGIWGGAQKGAKRLDIGPSASANVELFKTPSRVAIDWRFRVLGDAEPGSGPAVTLSAGF